MAGAPTRDDVGAPASGPSAPGPRSSWRSVALPTEHGGWGLTLEPGLLGVLVAPSWAGVCLGLGAMVAFVARTPVKFVLVDLSRHRRLPRTRRAALVAVVELLLLVALALGAVALAAAPFWWPVLVAAPLVGVELWFDMRSRSRRLAPQLAGAVGIGAVAAMIVLADGRGAALAAGVWLVLTARAVSSIPFVRARIAALHGRPSRPGGLVAADLAAVALAALAVGLEPSVAAGAVAVVVVIVYQRATAQRPVRRVAVLGIHQMLLGFGVVVITAVGVHLT